MKVLTLGLSPSLYISHGRIHAIIMEYLFKSGHAIASAAWGHDTNYFLPEEDGKGNSRFYHKFGEYKIPLMPIDMRNDPAIQTYKIIEHHKPDIVVSVGDICDVLFMKAVKMFVNTPFKWLAVLLNHAYPVNEKNIELIPDMDGVLCSYKESFELMSELYKKDEISLSYVGCVDVHETERQPDTFRIMTCGQNTSTDNVPLLMESVSQLAKDMPDVQLYVHSNTFDAGEYDMQLLKERFDPENKHILFPSKYVSLIDGYPELEFRAELARSDVFVDISVSSSSSLAIFEAISCGCLPLMSDVGCHRDVADFLADSLPGFDRDDFLVSCIEIMTRGEVYIGICQPDELKYKLKAICSKIKKGVNSTFCQEFVESHNRKGFLNDFSEMLENVMKVTQIICVESV